MSDPHDIEPVGQATIDCWRTNYGLDKRTPSDAARWWHDSLCGHAPSGCVAALGVALDEIERQSANAAILAQQVADLTAELAALLADGEVLAKANIELDGENEALTAERDALRAVVDRAVRVMRGGEGITDQGEAYDKALRILDAARGQA